MVAGTRPAGLIKTEHRRALSVDEFQRIAAAGIIDDDERLELLDGVLVTMSPINPPHAHAVRQLANFLARRLTEAYEVLVQDPVRLSSTSLPLPDVAIVLALHDVYERRHPEPADILLIVEVAHSTLRLDRTVKLPLYAAAGIPEVWILDIAHRRLLVHRRPSGGRYVDVLTYVPGDEVAPLAFPDLHIPVASLLVRRSDGRTMGP